MLETNRLLLRHFRPTDWPDVLEYGSQLAVAKGANFTPLKNKKAACSFEKILQRDGVFALQEKDTSKVIGNLGSFQIVRPDGVIESRGFEIGYALNFNFWGHGLMTEALTALCEYEKKRGTNFLLARVYADNEASKNVLVKTGFKLQEERQVVDVLAAGQKVSELIYKKTLCQKREGF